MIPSLKEISSQVSWHMVMLNIDFINHISRVLSLEYYLSKRNLAWASTNQQVGATHWISSKSICSSARKWSSCFFYFLYNYDLEWRIRSSKLMSKGRACWCWVFLFCFFMKSCKKGSPLWILKGQDKMRMKFITPTNLNIIPNSTQINCQIIVAELFALSHSCDLESRSRSIRLVSKCRVQQYRSSTKFKSNSSVNIQMHANISFFDTICRSYFPCFYKSYSKVSSGCSAWIARKWSQYVLLCTVFSLNCKKMKPVCFPLHWPCDPQKGQGESKWCQYGSYEKFGW